MRIVSGTLAVFTAATATLALSAPARAVTGTWTIRPAQPSATAFSLAAVASASSSSGLAAGTVNNGGEQGTVMRYDGANWGFVTVPRTNPDVVLNGAAMTSSTDGWVVGAGSEFGGFYSGTRPVALRWNGSGLTAAGPTLPTKSKFTAVSALASTNVYAVGRIGANSLVERWNGSSWSQVTVPDPNPANPGAVDSLSAVHARASNDIWAVGSFSGGPFSLHFDGTSWRVNTFAAVPGSTQTTIVGVTAAAAGDAWAVGSSVNSAGTFSTVTEHWTGTAWHVVPSFPAAPGDFDSLTGVSARAANDVWAVGSTSPASDPTQRTLSLHWDGTSWARLASPPAGGGGLGSIATRPGAALVLAVGTDINGFGFVMSHP
jgi:hypothetical protein